MKDPKAESVRHLTGFNTIFSDSAFNFTARILSNIFYFLFITFIVKVLGESKYGEYSLFLMVAQFIYIGFLVWLQSGILRYGREEFNETKKINKIFTAHLTILIPLIIILITSIFIFHNRILSYLKFDKIFLIIIIVYFLLNYLTEMFYYSLQAIGQIKTMSVCQVIEKILPLIIIFIVYYIFNISKLAYVISAVLIAHISVQLIIIIKTKVVVFFPLKFDKKIFKRYLKYSWPIFFASFGAYFFNWLDVAIIKKYMSLQNVGEFFYCQQIYNGLSQLSIVLMTILMPLIITLILKKRNDLLKNILSDLSIASALVLGFIINFLWLILYFIIIRIFNNNIFYIILTLKILMFSFILTIFIKILSSYILGYEKTGIYFIFNLLNFVIKLIFSFFLIIKFGIVGAAIATFLSSFFSFCFLNFSVKKIVNYEMKTHLFLIILLLIQIMLYFFIKNIYICFFINIITLFLFSKLFKIFDLKKISILNKVAMPEFIKRKIFIISKFFS